MPKASPKPRRTKVERNVYRRGDGKLEIVWRDGAGRQRCRVAPGGITAARRQRDVLLAERAHGERPTTNPRLRFGAAADRWLEDHVSGLRPATQSAYDSNVVYLRERFDTARLDAITPDDLAALVRDMRADGYAEWTISGTLGVANRIYRHARRRLGWSGTNPVADMLPSERAKVSQTPHRQTFTLAQVGETIAAAEEPWQTLLLVTALTGGRLSEVLGLTWGDLDLEELDRASVRFAMQLDRTGQRVPTKTTDSARTVPIPRPLAERLAAVKLARGLDGCDTTSSGYVFATRNGTAVGHRNVARALRSAQRKAQRPDGRWTFPILRETDERGRPVRVPRGALPSMHSFRHTFASQALAAGESIDEVAFLLGHRDGTVTRQVYVHEVNDVRRQAMRRSRIGETYGSAMAALELTSRAIDPNAESSETGSTRGTRP